MKPNAPKTSPSPTGKLSPKSTPGVIETASDIIVEEVKEIREDVVKLEQQAVKELKQLKQTVGPGVITGAADDDPSGIATYSITGAQFGLRLNWLTLFSLPMMIAVQDMAGRIGLVTGKGLAGVIKQHYPKWLLALAVFLLVTANTANVGANLGAIGAATTLIVGGPALVWVLVWTVVIGTLVVSVNYHAYARILKYLTLSLLAYVATAFVIEVDWLEVFRKLVTPAVAFDQATLVTIVAFLGTTISPYLFFWQASEEVEERKAHQNVYITQKQIRRQRLDTVIGMFFSQIVAFFIVLTTAITLHQNGITNIESAEQAAQALRPLAGDFAFTLFSLGIIGTGLLGVPVLAGSAAYALAESFGWKLGLNRKLGQAREFYGVIIVALALGVAMSLFDINPIKALFYTAVLNGIAAPILIMVMADIASNRTIMGDKTNARITTTVGYLTAGVMAAAAIALIWSLVS